MNGPGMAEMWKCGAEEGLSMCHLIDPGSLPAVDRMCRKFPYTPVVIDHFARVGIEGKIRERDLKQLFPEAHWNHLHLQIIFFGREYCPARGHDLADCRICGWAATKKRIRDEARKR